MNPDTLTAIAAMAAVTVATRLAGLALPPDFAGKGRLAAAFAAMPVAVLTALIAPAVLTGGWRDGAAALFVAAAAKYLPMPVVVIAGVAAAAALRAI